MDDLDATEADDPYAPARDALAGEGLGGDAADSDPAILAARLDDNDPLSSFADRYHVPGDVLYMDGNSLGPASDAALASLDRVVDEWRDLLIAGWTDADPPWFEVGERLGDALAPLVGAEPSEVVVGNSITVNIHTLVGTFLDELLAGNGPVREGFERADGTWAPEGDSEADPAVLVNELDFPSDHYAIRAQLRQRGIGPDEKLRVVESRDGRTIDSRDIEAALAAHDDIGIVFMPTALYRSGQLFDVARIAEAAHEAGAYAGFDAAHSAGAVPHAFGDAGVDFAVWCTFDILPRLKTRESHGTAPLDWDIRVCSLPPLSEVGILERGREDRLRAVPTSRYSYLHPNRVQTRSYFRCCRDGCSPPRSRRR